MLPSLNKVYCYYYHTLIWMVFDGEGAHVFSENCCLLAMFLSLSLDENSQALIIPRYAYSTVTALL